MARHTHHARIARQLADRLTLPYQQALVRVRAAATAGQLPSPLDADGIAAAVEQLATAPAATVAEPADPWTSGETRRCWELHDPDGYPLEDGEGVPHYRDAETALRIRDERVADLERYVVRWAATEYDRTQGERLRTFVPAQRECACRFVTCACCGYTLDENEWLHHFDDDAAGRAQAASWAEDLGWVLRDGAPCCGEECDHDD